MTTESPISPDQDVVDILTADHQAMLELIGEIK